MLRQALALAVLGSGTVLTLGLAAGPAAACGGAGGGSCGDTGTATSNGHNVTVTITGSMVKAGSGGSGGTTSVGVPSPCWYTQSMSGAEYFHWVESGEAAQAEHHANGGSYTPMPGYKQHKDDAEGHYYSAECDSGAYEDVFGPQENLDGFIAYVDDWFATHETVYVPAGEQPPTPPIPPQALLYAAQESLGVPEPHFALNPDRSDGQNTIVNIPTWFWLTDPTLTGDVTASAGGHSATVEVKLTDFKVTSDRGDSTGDCGGPGTPWSPGLGAGATSDCAIAFLEPAAHLGLTATTRWGVTWSYDGEPRGALDPITSTSTDTIGVGEVQTLVTDAR